MKEGPKKVTENEIQKDMEEYGLYSIGVVFVYTLLSQRSLLTSVLTAVFLVLLSTTTAVGFNHVRDSTDLKPQFLFLAVILNLKSAF